PRPPDLAPPARPTPAASPAGGGPASEAPVASGAPAASPALPTDAPVEGPVPAVGVEAGITFDTERFGAVEVERRLLLTRGATGWQVRWSPAVLFPELGERGQLRLARVLSPRGRIVAQDGTVFADNRDDGTRVYPQRQLAGQLVGYASEVTAEDIEARPQAGYEIGDPVGRSGLEATADDVLRGSPGWRLEAVPEGGGPTPVLESAGVPGADLVITIRPALQRAAEGVLAPYADAATAVVDPASGDIWALASRPAFDPNSLATGLALDGTALSPADFNQLLNKAALGGYPAGSAFKPFTLAAALATGVATAQSGVTCPPTWPVDGVTYVNFEQHSLPGVVSLAEAMAFSCNTTYMPLAGDVFVVDPGALPEMVRAFGFGAASGARYLPEEAGIVPDEGWMQANRGSGYGFHDQLQLSIGQGPLLVTPLQLANAYAAIGNGGTLWTPRIAVETRDPDGQVVESFAPEPIRRVPLAPEQLAYIVETMRAVVTLPYGTATAAFAGFGVPVAGKSGTAETGTPNPNAWFPAIAPAEDPTISVATVLVQVPLATGGSDAAPLVRQVMAAFFGG
ncbi:MAG TPA: penicillin-binding transpeptidase domain-containing protein, partial [Candidatus Limnocylindria bacterium]|nr:penicillin-binding transpeptidase domain-containing protein [Candidatus Limnocylindria bacterium]